MRRLGLALLLFSFLVAHAIAQSPSPMNRIDLHDGWAVQTSRKVQATGEAISTLKFQTKGWYRTSVPMTVVAVQVAAGKLRDPYYEMNLRKIAGITAYKIGEQFAHKPIPDDSPYAVSWWYRTDFRCRPIIGTWCSILTESTTARMYGSTGRRSPTRKMLRERIGNLNLI